VNGEGSIGLGKISLNVGRFRRTPDPIPVAVLARLAVDRAQ
jgi:hypothetical protein